MIESMGVGKKPKITDYDVDYLTLGCDEWNVYLPQKFPLLVESTWLPNDLINIICDYAYGKRFLQYNYDNFMSTLTYEIYWSKKDIYLGELYTVLMMFETLEISRLDYARKEDNKDYLVWEME